MDIKEKKKYSKKENHHTFLVFASGSIIMSSQGPDMKRAFYELINILLDNREEIEGVDELSREINSDNEENSEYSSESGYRNKSRDGSSSGNEYEYYSDNEDF